MTEKALTAAQEAFARGVATGESQAEAYRMAYPKSRAWKPEAVHQAGAKLMANPNVSARVRALKDAAAARAVITSAEVLKMAANLVRFDVRRLYREDGSPIPIHELDAETASAIQGVDIHEEYAGQGAERVFVGYTKKYKVADKNAALEKLFKHFGLYELDNKQKADPLGDLLRELRGNVVGPVAQDRKGS
jgi:phage terminase small subunit